MSRSPNAVFSPSASGGGLGGTLTTGKVPKATGASALGDSTLADTGSLLAGSNPLALRSVDQFGFSSSSSDPTVAADTGLGRDAAAVIKLTDGASGKGWFSNRAGFVRKTADQTVNNSTTLADISDLSVTLLAGRNYQLRGVLFTNTAVAASGLRAALAGSATFTDLRYMIQIWDLSTRSLGSVSVLNVLNTAVFKATISAVDNCILIEGCCTVNTGGTLKIQGAQGTADASNTLFKRGSFLTVEDIS